MGTCGSITNYAPSTGATPYVPANSTTNSFDNYTYDGLGNVQTDTNQDGEWTYTYDADSQLTQAIFTPNNTDPDGLTPQNLQYVYDAAGNRISETVNGVTTTYVSNNVNEYTRSTTNGVMTTYQYDHDGNLIGQTTAGSTRLMATTNGTRLTAVNGPGLSASYGYDVLGDRSSQTLNGVTTNFEIDPGAWRRRGRQLCRRSGVLTAHYTYGFGLVCQVSAAGISAYYDFNNIGSTVGITGTSGGYVNQYSYLPFGQTTTIVAALANPFTFVGQLGVTNDGSGTLAMGFRQYDPSTGQFISNDPLGLAGGDPNIRRYVGNNPVVFVDPLGLCSRPQTVDEKLAVLRNSSTGTIGPPVGTIEPPPSYPPLPGLDILRFALKKVPAVTKVFTKTLGPLGSIVGAVFTILTGATPVYGDSFYLKMHRCGVAVIRPTAPAVAGGGGGTSLAAPRRTHPYPRRVRPCPQREAAVPRPRSASPRTIRMP